MATIIGFRYSRLRDFILEGDYEKELDGTLGTMKMFGRPKNGRSKKANESDLVVRATDIYKDVAVLKEKMMDALQTRFPEISFGLRFDNGEIPKLRLLKK